jgi:hypothetical protein
MSSRSLLNDRSPIQSEALLIKLIDQAYDLLARDELGSAGTTILELDALGYQDVLEIVNLNLDLLFVM